ncbi:MAG: hypothetical protein SF123_00055 [Chloroflexota bacterium]|nr:hypothetical protein [Chloroflexota bacterium]
MNRILALAMIAIFLLLHPIHAQDASLSAIYSGWPITNMWWSADSRVFAFQGNMTSAPESSWYAYDVTSGRLTNSQTWPLQPTLNRIEQQALDSQETLGVEVNLVFSSPNGQFLVGSSENLTGLQNQSSYVSQATISNRTTNTINLIGLPIITQTSVDRYRVQWSDDSSTFVVSTSAVQVSALSFFYYVTGYAESNATDIVAVDMQPVMIDGQNHSILEVFDLSNDGRQVLLFASRSGSGRPDYCLIRWSSIESSSHVLVPGFDGITEYHPSAVFSSEGSDIVLIFQRSGINEVNLISGNVRNLYPDLGSERFTNAMFSPDGRYIALVERVTDAVFSVYVVAL